MKKRLLALFCALFLLLGMVSAVSADASIKAHTSEANLLNRSYIVVENNQSYSLSIWSDGYEIFDGSGIWYNDIVFDTTDVLTAQSDVSWITFSNQDVSKEPNIYFAENTTTKARSGNITFTGANFKATMKVTQYGKDTIASVKRSGSTVTVKLKYSKGAKAHYLYVNAYRTLSDGSTVSKTIYSDPYKKSTYKFNVNKDWEYSIGIATAVKVYGYYNWGGGDWYYFTVNKTSGSETYKKLKK